MEILEKIQKLNNKTFYEILSNPVDLEKEYLFSLIKEFSPKTSQNVKMSITEIEDIFYNNSFIYFLNNSSKWKRKYFFNFIYKINLIYDFKIDTFKTNFIKKLFEKVYDENFVLNDLVNMFRQRTLKKRWTNIKLKIKKDDTIIEIINSFRPANLTYAFNKIKLGYVEIS